mmetsp:Transcript_5338/g.12373  ORF Transcript_5338/g.12373 Transcript_5338/m.12373 type:complete len:119 (+) Transcript_5338:57-413(+)
MNDFHGYAFTAELANYIGLLISKKLSTRSPLPTQVFRYDVDDLFRRLFVVSDLVEHNGDRCLRLLVMQPYRASYASMSKRCAIVCMLDVNDGVSEAKLCLGIAASTTACDWHLTLEHL